MKENDRVSLEGDIFIVESAHRTHELILIHRQRTQDDLRVIHRSAFKFNETNQIWEEI